ERAPALLRAVRARQRHRPRAPDGDLEEPLTQVREGHLVLVDEDAEPVDEVGTAEALRQLAQGHETGSPPPAVPRGPLPCHGARSIQSRVTGFSPTPESSRFMTAAMVDRLSGLLMSARASTSTICGSPDSSTLASVGSIAVSFCSTSDSNAVGSSLRSCTSSSASAASTPSACRTGDVMLLTLILSSLQ